ncbi:MAG TPA: hypothetical protein DCS24_07935 [Erythrobacter sp.]|nr:hypothetical protein [Erythrobacter sp.]
MTNHPSQTGVGRAAFRTLGANLVARNVEARFADQSYRDPVEFGGDKLDPAELDRARQLLESAPKQRETRLG